MDQVERAASKRVIFLLLEGVELLDLAGPAEVFDIATSLGAPYELLFCATRPDLTTAQHLVLAQLAPLPELQASDLIILPGLNIKNELDKPLLDRATQEWLRRAQQLNIAISSVCTGAFALAEAGLLNHRRCTTHWRYLVALRRRYPLARVVDNVLFVTDGNLTTSAGIASGIDLALALVEKDQGAIFTARLARHLVIYLRRNGLHEQQSVYLQYRTHLHTGVHQAQDFVVEHLTERINLGQIAEAAGMSERNLNRVFKEANGNLTPIQYQQYLRLELARTLLSDPTLSLEEVATRCGFEDTRHFRRLWKTHFGVPPSVSREAGPTKMTA